MNLPHLFGTRRVGPDLIRQAGVHSNDWHAAHLYAPRSIAPYSVMPSYPWFFDDDKRPNERGLALITYLQWLGSWAEDESAASVAQADGGA
jgi:cbb3-type cytochrome oxidase cytochrome c subunit